MGWNSSLLGSNVVSSYQHIDNLRNDITAGKFWDSGETKYTKIAHGGTNGYLEVSSGAMLVYSTGKELRVYDGILGVGTLYTSIKHDGTRGLIDTSSGELRIQSVAATPTVIIGGDAGNPGKVGFWDVTLGAYKYLTIDNGAVAIT